jgi:putative PD-(D/E)XK family protein DUF4420
MAIPGLVQVFESLVMPMPAVTGNELAAAPIPGADTHRVAKDASGAPCLLIRQRAQTSRQAPIRLENLSASFDVPCTVRQADGKVEQDTFTIVRCSNHNPGLFPHFLKVISPMIAALGAAPTAAAVRRSIFGLVELFQALSSPGKKTIQGLWAELLIIRLAGDPAAMVAAWHRAAYEHFDFADGPQRIEVKSNSNRRREHHFSLEQLTPAGGSWILIASMFVERSGGGVSLQTLLDETRALLAADAVLISRFDAVVYAALGSSWSDAMDESFDLQLASASISFYQASAVPKPANPRIDAVFDVRFRSDLGAVPSLSLAELNALGGLARSAVPRTQHA